jgi:hypothetical protein
MYGRKCFGKLCLQGGYAVASLNPQTGFETYTPYQPYRYNVLVNFHVWQMDLAGQAFFWVSYEQEPWATSENPVGSFYARGADVDVCYRISPQLDLAFQNLYRHRGEPRQIRHRLAMETYRLCRQRKSQRMPNLLPISEACSPLCISFSR